MNMESSFNKIVANAPIEKSPSHIGNFEKNVAEMFRNISEEAIQRVKEGPYFTNLAERI